MPTERAGQAEIDAALNAPVKVTLTRAEVEALIGMAHAYRDERGWSDFDLSARDKLRQAAGDLEVGTSDGR